MSNRTVKSAGGLSCEPEQRNSVDSATVEVGREVEELPDRLPDEHPDSVAAQASSGIARLITRFYTAARRRVPEPISPPEREPHGNLGTPARYAMENPTTGVPMAIQPENRWQQLGRHRFRAPVGSIIDTPFPIVDGWVAIIWPDPATPVGWQRLVWSPDPVTGRGWFIPDRIALGDIVEFGSDPNGTRRWYGIVDGYEPGTWLTLQGPYPTPDEASTTAAQLLAAEQHAEPMPVPHATKASAPCHRQRRGHHPRN
jgi:hypothetical protein